MSGLFEHLAANDEMGRIARRKAIAVANKRIADRFGEFLTDTDAETVTERLDLVGEEFDNAIREACDEQGVEDHEPIIASIRESFLKKKLAKHLSEGEECSTCNTVQEEDVEECPTCRGAKDMHSLDLGPKKTDAAKEGSLAKEARRPKMCPYHKELVNASLQVGEPQYAAFAPLVGGDSHCGGGYEDKCNFKPPMVSQSYWDQKETDRLERKEQRELAEQGEQSHELEAPQAEETFDEPAAETDQATLADLENAPSAVAELEMDSVEAEMPEPVLASHNASWEITAVSDGDSWVKNESVEQPEGPSPKIDKKLWTGLEPIDTDAGPYKTVHQDAPERPDYSKTDSLGQATKDAVLEQTKAVTTEEKLPTADDNAGFNTDKNVDGAPEHTKTFPNKDQADPVTPHTMSSTDALNMHTADLLGDIGNAAKDATNFVANPSGAILNKGLEAAGLPAPPTPLDMAGDAVNGVANAAEGAGAAFNDHVYQPLKNMPDESVLQGDPYGGNRPADMSLEMNPSAKQFFQDHKGGSVTAAAHSVREEDGKFFVIEDGDEKAAGPFDTEEAAKDRAVELNAMENLESGADKDLAKESDQIDDEVLGKLPNSKNASEEDSRSWLNEL